MKNQKNTSRLKTSARKAILPTSLLLMALAANKAHSAILYFDPAGGYQNGGTYTWDTTTADWYTSDAFTGTAVTYNSADAACFGAPGFTGSITVDVNSAINDAGFFVGNLGPPGCNVTFAGTGSLNLASGAQATAEGGSDGNSVTMDIPMTGGTAESEEDGVNVFNLNTGNPTMTAFVLGATSNGTQPAGQGGGPGGVSFNNNTAFGIGTITSSSSSATRQIFTTASTPLTLANGFTLWGGTLSLGGNSSSPVTFTGNVALPGSGSTATLSVFNTGGTGASYTFSGIISGAGNLTATGAGSVVLGGANTYTGSTAVTSGGTLVMAIANGISTSSALSLSASTFSAGGFNETIKSLSSSGSSTLMFGAASGTAISATTAGTISGTLNLADWQGNSVADGGTSTDTLQFGSTLTAAQLGDIEFDGNAATLGEAAQDANGYITQVPEPSPAMLGLVGSLVFAWKARRRSA